LILMTALVPQNGGGRDAKKALPPEAVSPSKTSLTVYAIKAGGGVEPALASTLTSLFIQQLSLSPRLIVIDEAMIKKVMEQQALNQSDVSDTSIQVPVGKLIQAQKMVVGELSKLGSTYLLNTKLLDIATGAVEASGSYQCPCREEDLARLVAQATAQIRNHFGENVPAVEPPPVGPQPGFPIAEPQPAGYPTQCPAEGQKISVAIYPIKASGATEKAVASALTSLLSSELTPSPRLAVIEEAMLKEVIARQLQNESDACDDTSCQVEIGKLVKAQKMITGDLVKLGTRYILSLKLVDIQTGTMEFSTRDQCACNEDQVDQLVTVAAARVRSHFCEKVPE